MDPALIVALSGFILGSLGLWQGRKKDKTDAEDRRKATETTARDVASRAADSAVGALNAALDHLQGRVEDLEHEVVELKKERADLRSDNAVLLKEVRQCHDDKTNLEQRIRLLERAP